MAASIGSTSAAATGTGTESDFWHQAG
jgi:hypothetical protein